MFLHYLSNGGTRGQRNSLINYNGYYYTKFSRLIKNLKYFYFYFFLKNIQKIFNSIYHMVEKNHCYQGGLSSDASLKILGFGIL